MAKWSLLAAAEPAVKLALAAAASARLSGGDTKTERPCAIAATMVRMGSTHLQQVLLTVRMRQDMVGQVLTQFKNCCISHSWRGSKQ